MMEDVILKIENLGKQYRLGLVGTGTLSHDLNRWWHKVRGKDDPYLKVGAVNDRSAKATTNYVWALKDINIEVKRGEVLGIIGKNGAGKSTLLKILSRVTGPTEGTIKSNGRIASLLEVGTGFHPELTGRENIYLNGAILGMTKAEIKVKEEEIIEFSGCAMYIDTPVKRYSSGMRVRLAFAVAAHLEPDILVIDEVLAVGDAEFQKKAVGKMQDISSSEGRTVLFVSHNMGAVKSLCTRAVVLADGHLKFEGDTDAAVEFYLKANWVASTLKLDERTDRKGKRKFRFTDMTILNSANESCQNLLSGESYTFRMEYRLVKPISNTRIRLSFVDFKGDVKFICNNRFSGSTFELDETEHGIIECTVYNLPLPNGDYSINLACSSYHRTEDEIEGACSFSVVGGDFFGTGKEQISHEGVLVKNSFKLL